MTHAFASSRLTAGLAAVCSAAMVPFAWLHLFGARLEGQSLAQAAHLQLQADMALPSIERWLILGWLLMPVAWAALAFIYLRSDPVAPPRVPAILLATLALILGALSTLCYGVGTAPLFLSVPIVGGQLALRLRPVA